MDTNIDPPFDLHADAGHPDAGPAPARDRMSSLRLLSSVTLVYLCCAAVFLFAVGTNPLYLLVGVVQAFPGFFYIAARMVPAWVLVVLLAGFIAIPRVRRGLRERPAEIAVIAVYCSLFTLTFGAVKTHLPAVFPFWADDFLTRIDQLTSPRASVAWMDGIDLKIIRTLYFNVWVIFATFFPILLAIVERDETRRRVFTILWLACWIGLGNILAAAVMSVGPIFLDRLPGGDPSVYPEVFALLARPEAAPILAVKERLWGAYAEGNFMVGSGISAFPSVHVGMATVVALYFGTLLAAGARARRGTWAGHLGRAAAIALPVAIVVAYQLVTVYIGMHYAIDGYVSIALMLSLYLLLRRERGAATGPGA